MELPTVIDSNTENPLSGSELPPDASEQAATLAGWLLAFSRRQAQQFRDIDFNALILGLKRHLQAILPQDIELKIALEPTLSNISADEHSLEEALIHLVVNARDAMPEGGRLTLETASVQQGRHNEPENVPRGYALLRVTDTGIGMDASADLGLSAVNAIVKQARGWISVYTEKGAGSRIEIFLPCSERAWI
jgi:two-component system, cell cycle sensor histidine kinase and response regulator CckA